MAKARGFGNWFKQAVDAAFIPGNAYNSTTGRWNPATTKTGIAGVVADQFLPGGSNLVGMAANSGLLGQGIQSGLRNENTYNNIADQYGDTLDWAQNYTRGAQPDFGFNPQVSVGSPQYMPQQGYNPGSASGLLDGYLSKNVQKATDNTNSRMDAEMQAIQDRINGQSVPTMGAVNARPIGGGLSFGGGHYNNGVGAGTGFGAANYTNDAWGQAAAGFGVGAGNSGFGNRQAGADTRGFKFRS